MEETTNNMLDINSLISDFESLKISALTNAAKISPFITEVTIGPKLKSNSSDSTVNLNNENDKKQIETEKISSPNKNEHSPSFSSYPVEIDYKMISGRVLLNDIEKKRQAYVKKEMIKRQIQMENTEIVRENIFKENLIQAKKNVEIKLKESEKQLLNEIELEETKARQFDEKQKQQLEAKKEIYKKKTIQLKNDAAIRLKSQNWNKIQQNQLTFKKYNDMLLSRVKTKNPNNSIYKIFHNEITDLTKMYETLTTSLKSGKITINEVELSEKLIKSIEKIIDGFDMEFIKLTKQYENDKRLLEEKEKQLKIEQEKIEKQKQQKDQIDGKLNANLNIIDLPQFLPINRSFDYKELMKYYNSYTESINPLLIDENMKKFRFECQKAINIPVNAISGVNAQHILDKYERLSKLLSGETVKVGDNTISANSHPLGQRFCTLLLAKKFVSQADTMISSNAQAAYPIASVLVALWQKFSDVGKLFLAHLYKECPYLVPYFIPQFEGQSSEEYYSLLGYRYVENKLEKQDMFLKRMSGYARLYSAVLITKVRANEISPHPHNIENGWTWLCNILNLEPLPDICATFILEFLQICGSTLISLYSKQFLKVLRLIKDQYFIKLNNIDEGGPKTRLEVFLINVFKNGRIEEPPGILANNFW